MGPGLIPGRRHQTVQEIPEEVRRDHATAWREWFGEFDDRAIHRPSQTDRNGVALLLLQAGVPRGFVKVRPAWDPGPERRAMSRLGEAETFATPAVVGIHDAGGWTSLGFTALPGHIHTPRVSTPIRAISEEVSELISLDSPCPPGWRPMHGDMGPWNLRSMQGIGPVLFDWEDVAAAPPYADMVFYLAAAEALGLRAREAAEGKAEAVDFWRERIPQRFGGSPRDDRLARAMLRALIKLGR